MVDAFSDLHDLDRPAVVVDTFFSFIEKSKHGDHVRRCVRLSIHMAPVEWVEKGLVAGWRVELWTETLIRDSSMRSDIPPTPSLNH